MIRVVWMFSPMTMKLSLTCSPLSRGGRGRASGRENWISLARERSRSAWRPARFVSDCDAAIPRRRPGRQRLELPSVHGQLEEIRRGRELDVLDRAHEPREAIARGH